MKTLDSLLPYASEAESAAEQKNLEALIARYKNLIPTIEITMVKTEVFSKCYTYRREVHEVVCLLSKVKDQTVGAPQPESLDNLRHLIHEQQVAINQLDHQRPHIMSMLQRGRDLSKDVHAPKFVSSEIKTLETGWNDTYSESVDKLRTLKSTEVVWDEFQTQKQKVLDLLGNAETELRSITPLQTHPNNVLSDLKNKRELNTALIQASRVMIGTLHDLSSELAPLTDEGRRPLLQKEVTEIEKRFFNTVEHVKDRVNYLEDYNTRWNNYKSRVGELQNWSLQAAPQLIESVQSRELSPEERVAKADALQATISEKMRALDILASDASELAPKEGNVAEAKRLRGEVSKLQEMLSVVNRNVNHQASAAKEDLVNWQQYQAGIQEIKPWIERSESQVNLIGEKPVSLQQAVHMQQKAKQFEVQCFDQQKKLHGVASISNLMTCKTNAPDELDAVQSRWSSVHENAKQTASKYDRLVANWQSFDADASKLEQWIDGNERAIAKRPSLVNTPHVDKLEKELVKLKSFNNEISEQQAKVIALTQGSEQLALGLAPEGAAEVKERATAMRANITKLSESVRAKINEVSDAIMSRQDFNAQLATFSNWMDQLRAQTAQVEDLYTERVEPGLQSVHIMMQEHSDKKPAFNAIYDEVKNLALSAAPEEGRVINDSYTSLVTNYQSIEDDLQRKKQALEQWNDFIGWKNETDSNAQHFKHQLDNADKLGPVILQNIVEEITTIIETITTRKLDARQIDGNPAVHLKDSATGKPLSATQVVNDLENKLENLKLKAENRIAALNKVEEKKLRFVELENDLGRRLNSYTTKLNDLVDIVPTEENIEQIIHQLITVNNELQSSEPLKERVRDEATQLIREDISSMPAVQESVLVLDKRWDELQQEITKRIQRFTVIDQTMKEYDAARNRFDTEIERAQSLHDLIETKPTAENGLQQSADKSRKALEQVRRSKAALDELERKGSSLSKLLDSIENIVPNEIAPEVEESHAKWHKLHEQTAKNAQLYETEAIMWNQIDDMKNELVPWLDDTIQSLNDAADNTLEIEYGPIRLNKYRSELPSYVSIRTDIEEKITELTRINQNAEIPALTQLQETLAKKFDEAEQCAQNLDEVATSFDEQEKELRRDVKKTGEAINKIREQLIKCDDMSGDNTNISQRLQNCQALKAQLLDQENELDNLRMRVDEMKFNYPTFAESIVPKELNNVQKRLEVVSTHANKIEDNLLQFLRKFHQDKVGMLQRLIGVQKEKIAWCVPEPTSDKYNLEVKRSSMNDVQKGIADCIGRKEEVQQSLAALNQIDSPEHLHALEEQLATILGDIATIESNYDATKAVLDDNVELWTQYENQADSVNTWLKDIETKIKNEAAAQLPLQAIADKEQELKQYDLDVKEHKPLFDDMNKTSKAIMEKNVEARVGQVARHMVARHQAASKNIGTLLERVYCTKKTATAYNKCKSACTDWIKNARVHFNELARMGSPGSGPSRQQLELVKAFVNNLPSGQAHVNEVVDTAEALYTSVTPDDRDRVRNEVRQLREDFDNIHDEANSLLSQVESLLIQKTTVEESYTQVKQWLNESKNRIGDEAELYPTLAEKKAALQRFKAQLQDNNLHKNALRQLQDKVQSLADIDAEEKVKSSIKEYDDLNKNLNKRIAVCENQITSHEAYDAIIEKAQDWLKSLRTEAVDLLNDGSFEKDGAEVKLNEISNIIAQKPEGDTIFDACRQQLETVLVQTHPSGHPALINAFENGKKEWDALIGQCQTTHDKLNQLCSQWNAVDSDIGNVESWLRQTENFVKDQSLKSTAETKKAHLDKLQKLNEEIVAKAPEFAAIVDQCHQIEGESDVNLRVSRLNTRYQTLKNLCKENIARYGTYTKDHDNFNDEYNQFRAHLQDALKDLGENSEIVGDLGVLQARQTAIRNLAEQRINDASTFENIIDRGEKLYVHTSPEGREIIRQQLRNLRSEWERFSDELNATSQKIEQCLLQFGDFSAGQEQLTKWLKDVEKAMQSHTELKSTLQEKRAQLQNHKLMHQDIASHNLLVETVCEKAQLLVDQTQDESLNVYLQSIKQLFTDIVAKSQNLLGNLDNCVQQHQNYNNLAANLKSWLNGEKQRLDECDDTSGEKGDINRKLNILQQLSTNNEHGRRLLGDLMQQAVVVKKCTAPKGIELIDKELNDLQQEFASHCAEVEANKQKQIAVLSQWNDFDSNLDDLNKWCRATEAVFRDQQQQSTLEDKAKQLEIFKQHRDEILQKQKSIDEFTDKAHTLLNSSGAERLKPATAQLVNRYQALHALSKEVVSRWQALLDDHRKYSEKLDEVRNWLTPIENQLASVEVGEPAEAALEHLMNQQENANDLLSALDTLGEKILPETSTQGREKIRGELHGVHDRWDKADEDIRKLQKRQEAQTMQLSSYHDILQQVLVWLSTLESSLVQENPNTWTSPQEIRSKLLKYKSNLQDIAAHKRIIETLNDKANSLIQSNAVPNAGEIKSAVEEVNRRYDALGQNCTNLIGRLEDAIEVYLQFNEMQKYQQDYQKNLWDRLGGYTDYSGNKPALQTRLLKINEISDSLPEGSQKLNDLTAHVERKTSLIPSRAREAMARDLTNMKVDFDKFNAALQDVKNGLDSRLQQWSDYDNNLDRLVAWLTEAENSLKNYQPKNTLEEKQEQLTKFQALIASLHQNESEFDKVTDESSDLLQNSGETRISVNARQIASRFQSIQAAAKEIVKKCEQSVVDHNQFNEKYKQCANWLANAQNLYNQCCNIPAHCSREDLLAQQQAVQEILGQQGSASLLLNNVVELGEKLYPSTALEGREMIRDQITELSQLFEKLFDNVQGTNRLLQNKLSKWSGFEKCADSLEEWLSHIEVSPDIILRATLDDKRNQLQAYRDILSDIQLHQADILNLKDTAENLPERNENVEAQLRRILDKYDTLQKRVHGFVERYEVIVSDHQQYCKAVIDTQDFIEATLSSVESWGDLELERASLRTNLNRLKNLHANLRGDDAPRIESLRRLADRVIPTTVDAGKPNIQTQIDSSQQEWEGLLSLVQSSIELIENKLQQWDEFERLKEECVSWLRDTDNKLHAIDLKATCAEKKSQLDELKALQGEVRAKELEIDNVSEKAQLLQRGAAPARYSQITDLIPKYQQVSHKVKELTTRWQQYVTSHQDFDNHVSECSEWLNDINSKLDFCSDLSATSQKDLETKLEIIQDMLLLKDEGFAKVQSIVEMAQGVLANTAPHGHDSINKSLSKLQDDWSAIALKMVDIKAILDQSINQWSGFLDQVQSVTRTNEWLENALRELSELQTTMTEKRAQLERIKTTEERVRVEKIEVDALKAKAAEMLSQGQQSQNAYQAQQILDRFDQLAAATKKLLADREEQYRDHRLYKEAYDDLLSWISRAREKIPSLKQQPLGDKLSIENSAAPLDALMNKKAQGELLVEHLQHTGEVVMASTSPHGKELIQNDIKALRESFENLFKDLKQQKDNLEATLGKWREFKDEYERLCEWLQQIDILVKNHKLLLLPSLAEKEKQVIDMRGILDRLEKGQSDIDKFNAAAAPLLASHLDTYVNNQLRHLNSRYQVQVNLAKDVLKKVETNCDQHKEYEDNLGKAKQWIEKAWETIRNCSEASSASSKEVLQQRLDQIQDLIRNREEGQTLVHSTVNNGEKVMRGTRSDGREDISNQIRDLQTDWDRLVKKMSTAKVHLETSLLQWADYSSSYSQLQQWITDREAKLQQACEQKVAKSRKGQPSLSTTLSERKANLRQTNNIVQDIVSFEPMIQSVTSKASDLMQAAPATEISSKYETLSKQAKDLYDKQKEEVDVHQALIDAENDFAQWLRNAKERLSKCSEPTGEKEILSSKISQLTILESEVDEGRKKLEKTLEQGEIACKSAEPEDKEIIEEAMAFLQDEFDHYL